MQASPCFKRPSVTSLTLLQTSNILSPHHDYPPDSPGSLCHGPTAPGRPALRVTGHTSGPAKPQASPLESAVAAISGGYASPTSLNLVSLLDVFTLLSGQVLRASPGPGLRVQLSLRLSGSPALQSFLPLDTPRVRRRVTVEAETSEHRRQG
eukprot:1971830-Rhodomonas_salina.1